MECKMTRCPDPWVAFALCHALRKEPERLGVEDFLAISMLTRVITKCQHGLFLDTVETWMGEDGAYSLKLMSCLLLNL